MPFELCSRVLISTLFLIIFLLFTSLDTSGTWNMNRPATKQVLGILIQLCRVQKILFWQKTGHKILFLWSQAFCQF